ncbi:MAG: PTS sugar transporter subunit IIA [Candidatus Omnitrophota bacterium]|jgi:PTS system nitrogen regulatory IIA component
MQLTIKEVSRLLNVSERTLYRWINKKTIPAYRILDQYRFDRAELLEWVNNRRINVSPEIFSSSGGEEKMPSLEEALQRGGIFYRVGGNDKQEVLKEVVSLLRLPEKTDREFLFKVLLAREELASTAVGGGIAIPHVRNPIVLNIHASTIALCFPEKAVDFGAVDGKPVHALFTLVSPTARVHLQLLSRLAFVLQQKDFKDAVLRQRSREEIFSALQKAEAILDMKKGKS